MCTCIDRIRCPYHEQLEQDRVAAVSRVFNNKLTALARNLELPDEQWCRLMYLYTDDDLHLLLEEAES